MKNFQDIQRELLEVIFMISIERAYGIPNIAFHLFETAPIISC